MIYQIWVENTLDESTGLFYSCLCSGIEAKTFQEACNKHLKKEAQYSSQKLTLYGNRLFSTAGEAKRAEFSRLRQEIMNRLDDIEYRLGKLEGQI